MLRRVSLLLSAVVLISACGAASSAAPDTVPTVPVGELPAPVTEPDATADAASSESTTPRSTSTLPAEQQVGAIAAGNRVILLGDSVLASTSRRYGNNMCTALVPLGWQVEVDAETSRPVQFGNKVLDKRLSAGWDVGVILLGNNYGGDQAEYRTQLEKMVTRLSPGPVVLLTVTEFTPSRVEVNDVIREMAAKYPNVHLVDWAQATADRPDFTGADGLHLTETGRNGLADNVAFELGTAPEQPGKCLSSSFADDSGGPVTGTTLRPGSTQTTVKKPTGSTTSTPAGGSDTTLSSVSATTSASASSVATTVTTAAPTVTTATSVTIPVVTTKATPTPVTLAPGSSVAAGAPVPGETNPPAVP
jgi:hypothetical protein